MTGPPSLRSNLATNIVANAVIAAAFILSIPLLVRYMGIEAYGLVGFFVVAQSVVLVLDLGLNVMLTREFAIGRGSDLRSLLRTAEVLYGSGAALIAIVWTVSAVYLRSLVNPIGLSEDTIYRCFLLMGPAVALQLPVSLYSGALFGLQKQAVVSGVGAAFSVLRNLGVIPILHLVSLDPQTYFGWQLFCTVLHVPVLAALVWRTLPHTGGRARFAIESIAASWRFALGVGLITLATTLLAHVDKVVLVRLVSLESFGFYTLAAAAANGLHWLIQPVFRAMMPRLAKHTDADEKEYLVSTYHQGSQLMAMIVFPAAAIWIFFSYELMLLWQRSPQIADGTYLVVSLLMIAGVLNSVVHMPYALQLAFGRTRLQLFAVLTALLLSVPLTIAMAQTWAGPGAAAAILALYGGILLFVVPLMHRRLLPGEGLTWFLKDVMLPGIAVTISAIVCRLLFVEAETFAILAAELSVAFAIMVIAGLGGSSFARTWLAHKLIRAKS